MQILLLGWAGSEPWGSGEASPLCASCPKQKGVTRDLFGSPSPSCCLFQITTHSSCLEHLVSFTDPSSPFPDGLKVLGLDGAGLAVPSCWCPEPTPLILENKWKKNHQDRQKPPALCLLKSPRVCFVCLQL